MKKILKRLAALTFMLLMMISCVPASAVEGSVVDFSASTSAYDMMPQNRETGNVTITFIVNEKDYVRDPNSGNTHLKVKKEVYDAFQGCDLQYEVWESTGYYKITSLGTVCTFSIPSGSTLEGQGYTLPNLEVNNCNDVANPQDGYRYADLRSWVTEDGKVCNEGTVFTADTTLYIQLGEGVPFYTIDFVCGEDNHSIFTSLPFNLGQCLPANNIAEAAEAVKWINPAFCQHGSASGETLLGWQLKNNETGAMDNLTEDLAITNVYTETQYGSAIKAYALWNSTSVAATFAYHDGTQNVTQTRMVASGAKFSEIADIPDMTAYTPKGSFFAGWQYTDDDGNVQYATDETVVTANMAFTAVFENLVKATFQIAYQDESEEWVYEEIEVRELKPRDAIGALPDLSGGDPQYDLFYKWVYTDENGAEQTATAETVITEDTVITQVAIACGDIFFYDVMLDGSADEKTWLNLYMPAGMTVAHVLENCEDSFEDGMLLSECVWRTAVNGELADLENTVVSAEEPISLYTHTYRLVLTLSNTEAEMLTNGRSSVSVEQGDDGSVTMTITAREGEAFDRSAFITDDGVDLMRYVWKDEQGNPVNLGRIKDNGLKGNVVLASDGEIVNNVMRLTLTLDGQTITHTIVKPNGSILTAEDFVVNGIDLTDYAWVGPGGGYDLDSMIIGKYQLTEDITLTSNGLNNGLDPVTNRIHFYVYVDNKPFKVVSKDVVTTYKESDKDRRYIPVTLLASIYGEYGFSASQMGEDSRYFPHRKSGGTDALWGDAPPLFRNGAYYSPIVQHDSETDVFYLPEQSITNNAAVDNGTVVQANSFYTVKVFDPFEIVYGANELPAQTLTYVGGDTSMTVQAPPEGLSWKCVGKETNREIPPTKNADGTLTFVIEEILEPYEISLSIGSVPADRVFVVYDLNLPGEPAEGEDFRPKVNGHREYLERLEAANAGEYELLAPEPTSYIYKSNKYLGDAAFEGWLVNGELIQPGTKRNLSQYAGQVVNLQAQWGRKYGAATSSSVVNFFVALNAVPEGTTAWQGNTDQSLFTNSVYTSDCGVTGDTVIHSQEEDRLYTGSITVNEETHYLVLGETDGNDLNARHNTIVNTLTAGYEKEGVTFRCTFPTDETVLKNIRRMVENGTEIRINGRRIEADELTTSFFTIKWYVYKVSSGDGWHIDGILVSKSSEMIVTKTFAGDEEVIEAVSDEFSIVVAGKEGQTGMVHAGSTLKLNSEGVQKNGNTYTWKVPVDQYYRYSVTENGYKYTEDLATYKAQYRVRHSENNSENIGWTNYSDNTITVTGKGYNQTDDERLQVDFLNTYTKPGTVVVQKIDAVTGNLMPNVTFRIGGKRTDGSNLQMYDLGGSHYTADPKEGMVLTSTITTNASGQAYLWIGGGTYWLEEIVPNGYDDPGRIVMVLEGDAKNSYKVIAITSASAKNEESAQKSFVEIANESEGNSKLTLIVKNHSRTINLKVIKNWKDGENNPVTIQLYRNGKALGADYTVPLNGEENWEHTFYDLPLYADGGLAQYTIREEAIGEYKFSDEYADGYQYYNVSYSGMQYLDEDGEVTTEMPLVKTIALQADNERNRGELSIAKVDEKQNPVADAIFYLYRVPDDAAEVPKVTEIDNTRTYEISGMMPIGVYTSSENGTVSFGNMPAGRYYLVEHKAPMGYVANDLLYSLQFDGYTATMQYYEDGQWTVTPQRVVNKSYTVDIPVEKIWMDAENTGKRPSFIDVTLTGTVDGAVVSMTTRRLSAENSDTNLGEAEDNIWLYTFEDLPLYSGGKPIVYTLTEAPVAGYETSIVDPQDRDNLPQFRITNTLLSNLTYTVNKRVEGNAIDLNKKFDFVAKVYNSNNEPIKEINFQLSHNDHSYVITDLPFGAIVEVSEKPEDYSAEYMLGPNRMSGSSYTSGLILDNSQGITFINTKNIMIDTGVDLDGLPYIMMLLGATGIGLVWLIARRRRDEE